MLFIHRHVGTLSAFIWNICQRDTHFTPPSQLSDRQPAQSLVQLLLPTPRQSQVWQAPHLWLTSRSNSWCTIIHWGYHSSHLVQQLHHTFCILANKLAGGNSTGVIGACRHDCKRTGRDLTVMHTCQLVHAVGQHVQLLQCFFQIGAGSSSRSDQFELFFFSFHLQSDKRQHLMNKIAIKHRNLCVWIKTQRTFSRNSFYNLLSNKADSTKWNTNEI